MKGSVENEKDETTIAERALRDGARCWDDAWCDLGGSVTVVPFVDVQPDDWYIDVVKYALENGLMTGVSETEFAPDLATTRGMVASVLYRLEGGPEAEVQDFLIFLQTPGMRTL